MAADAPRACCCVRAYVWSGAAARDVSREAGRGAASRSAVLVFPVYSPRRKVNTDVSIAGRDCDIAETETFRENDCGTSRELYLNGPDIFYRPAVSVPVFIFGYTVALFSPTGGVC